MARKHMKRLTALICALVLALSITPISAIALQRDGTVSFKLDTVYSEPDSDVSVTLTLTGEYAANALTVFVDYDHELLEMIGDPVPGEVWDDISAANGLVQTNPVTQGRFGLMAITPNGEFSAQGVLFTLNFHVAADAEIGASIPLVLDVKQFTSYPVGGELTSIPFTQTNGAVVLSTDPQPEPIRFMLDSVYARPDTEVSITLSIEGAAAATALTAFVNYNSELLSLVGEPEVGAVWSDMIDHGGLVQTNTGKPGRFGFIGIVPQGDFCASGSVFTLHFHVSPNAEPGEIITLELEIKQFTYNNLDGSVISIPFNATNGSVTILDAPLPGDVDCNGIVQEADISLLVSYLMNYSPVISPQGMLNADANLDGKVDVLDPAAIWSIIIGG